MKKFLGALAVVLAFCACHTPESNLERVCATATAAVSDARLGPADKAKLVAEKEGTFFNYFNNTEYEQAFNKIAVAEPNHKSEPLHAYAEKNGIDWECPAVDEIFGPPRTSTTTGT